MRLRCQQYKYSIMSNTTKLEPTGVLFPDSTLQTTAAVAPPNPTNYVLATPNAGAVSRTVLLDPGQWELILDFKASDNGGSGYFDTTRSATVSNVGSCSTTLHFVVTGDGGHGRYIYASGLAVYRFTITGATATQIFSIDVPSAVPEASNNTGAIAYLTKLS